MSEKPSAVQAALIAALKRKAEINPASAESVNPLIERMGGTPIKTVKPDNTYVAVDSARVFGKENKRQLVEGQLYIRNADGTLRPVSGSELIQFSDLYPDFAKTWRIGQEDEDY